MGIQVRNFLLEMAIQSKIEIFSHLTWRHYLQSHIYRLFFPICVGFLPPLAIK